MHQLLTQFPLEIFVVAPDEYHLIRLSETETIESLVRNGHLRIRRKSRKNKLLWMLRVDSRCPSLEFGGGRSEGGNPDGGQGSTLHFQVESFNYFSLKSVRGIVQNKDE
jgi:hypothetical protein